jgi:serine/threonine protein kinase
MSILEGRYFLGAEIGAGAYGVVCRAVDMKADRKVVAVKTIDFEMLPADRREFAMRTVETEIKIMRTLDHPNVLRALDLIVNDKRRHIVLEFCEGPDLQAVLSARGALEADESRSVLRQCLLALEHLHDRGIIHRDIKPTNTMFVHPFSAPNVTRKAQKAALRSTRLTSQPLKLIDFGLARVLPSKRAGARQDSLGKASPSPSLRRRATASLSRGFSPSTPRPPSAVRRSCTAVTCASADASSARSCVPHVVSHESSVGGGDAFAFAAKDASSAASSSAPIISCSPQQPSRALSVPHMFGLGSPSPPSARRPPNRRGCGGSNDEQHAILPTDSQTPPQLARCDTSPGGGHFELSVHGTQSFLSPEILASIAAAAETGTAPRLVGITTHEACALDVYALGLMLRCAMRTHIARTRRMLLAAPIIRRSPLTSYAARSPDHTPRAHTPSECPKCTKLALVTPLAHKRSVDAAV